MSFPQRTVEWLKISKEYEEKWNFPNCFGAADGKHITLFQPAKSGSTFYNYKGFYSVVLMALVGASYKFIYVDAGCQGRISDGGVIMKTQFYQKLMHNELDLPGDKELTPTNPDMNNSFLDGTEKPKLPYVFVADDAFSLSRRCTKPFGQKHATDGQRIFNYRLSRARRTSENAFGILVQRFHALLSRMNVLPETACSVTLACCKLHRILCSLKFSYAYTGYKDEVHTNGNIIEGE